MQNTLSKNYGDLFVFWDKLFGTFQKEDEQPIYGLTHPLKSHSFIWQHAHYFLEMAYAFRTANGLKNKLTVIFGKPEYLDQNIRTELEKKYLPGQVNANFSLRYRIYILLQITGVVIMTFVVSLWYYRIELPHTLTAVAVIIITLINCGALLGQRTWIYYLEHFRILVLAAYVSILTDQPTWLMGALTLSILMLWPASVLKKKFLAFIYG